MTSLNDAPVLTPVSPSLGTVTSITTATTISLTKFINGGSGTTTITDADNGAVIGGLIGFEFPVANKLYLARCGFDERKTGVIYGVDLLGSCIGALLVSMGMLPVIGSLQTLGVVALLNGLVLLLVAKNLGREHV